MRLDGGDDSRMGRVEVLHDGVWGTVCDEDWDDRDALVVCRSLGFRLGTRPSQNSVKEGEGPIWLSRVHCTGDEHRLEYCRHDGWGNNACKHLNDAEVICK